MANLYGFSSLQKNQGSQSWLLSKRATEVNVLAAVDVLVIGGSAAGWPRQQRPLKKGPLFFLSRPNLIWVMTFAERSGLMKLPWGQPPVFLKCLHTPGQVPTPAHVKTVLQKQLVDNHIDFLMSSYAGGIILDDEEDIAGVVVANRSGEQIIRARTVIDATNTALVARMIGVGIKSADETPSRFMFRVVGNKVIPDIKHKVLRPLVFKEKEYPVTEYHFSPEKKINSFSDFQVLEQTVRDKTWDPEQIDASDILMEISSENIKSENNQEVAFKDAGDFNISALKPKGLQRLYVLNTYADVTFDTKESMLLPGNMMAIGLQAWRVSWESKANSCH